MSNKTIFTSKKAADRADNHNWEKYTRLAEQAIAQFPNLLHTWDAEEVARVADTLDSLVGKSPESIRRNSQLVEDLVRIDRLTKKFPRWKDLPKELLTPLGTFYLFVEIEQAQKHKARLAKEFIDLNPKKAASAYVASGRHLDKFSIGNPLLNKSVFYEVQRRLGRASRKLKAREGLDNGEYTILKEVVKCLKTQFT